VHLAAFPNPAQDHLTITGLPAAQAMVYVLDATGRTVLEMRVPAAHERAVVAVAGLPAGVYTAHVPGQGVVRFTKE
jgi:hypothetical protein